MLSLRLLPAIAIALGLLSAAPSAATADNGTITEIVLESGGDFDSNRRDYDILLNAVVTAGLAEALRQEMLLHGVTVTLFYPPTTDTPGLEKENEDKHPISWAIESENWLMKTYSAEAVAGAILRSVERGRFENWIGWDSWLVFVARRTFPSLFRMVTDADLRKAVKKTEQAAPPAS